MIIVGTLQISIYTYMYYNGLCVVLYACAREAKHGKRSQNCVIGCDRLNVVNYGMHGPITHA